MKQSRMISLFKSLVSTAVGFVVAYVANMLILPLFGLEISHSANLLLTSIYTVISIARGYFLERVFEALGWRQRISPFATAMLFERQEHVTREGYDTVHDDDLAAGILGERAMDYLAAWTLEDASTARRSLIKAGSLVIAEGDKFDRSRKSKRSNVFLLSSRANKSNLNSQ